MNKLKRCPFCGNVPEIMVHSFYESKTKTFSYKNYGVMCHVCHTQGYQFYETEQTAINAWNGRVNNG